MRDAPMSFPHEQGGPYASLGLAGFDGQTKKARDESREPKSSDSIRSFLR